MSPSQLSPHRASLVGGKYRLEEVIGSGGAGTVYRATHLWTGREVAVKVLNPNLPHFRQLRDAFLREARATVQLQHANVVEVLDMGEDGAGTTYMVMELLDGPTLRDVLVERGRLSPDDTATIVLPLIDALEKAHELGIVHKDFKPENIILSLDASGVMTPKLLDFGVAQILRETRPKGFAVPHEVIVGTPQYMSPEQARDERDLIGPQTDVWGVGIVWYECLTGRSPFDGDTALEVLTAVCEAPIDFSEVPEAQASFLTHALERSTQRRTQSLSVLRAQIEGTGVVAPAVATEQLDSSYPPPPSQRPSYVRRTLHGTGTGASSVRIPRALPAQIDSELLHLPKKSDRKAAIGGIVLAAAVALAAWWTIAASRPSEPWMKKPEAAQLEPPGKEESPSLSATIEEPRLPEASTTGKPVAAEAAGAQKAKRDTKTEVVADQAASEPVEAEDAPADPAPVTPKAEPSRPAEDARPKAVAKSPTRTKPRPNRDVELPPSPRTPSPNVQKPPDLVKEW
jgi:serine/threonine protein kinase